MVERSKRYREYDGELKNLKESQTLNCFSYQLILLEIQFIPAGNGSCRLILHTEDQVGAPLVI